MTSRLAAVVFAGLGLGLSPGARAAERTPPPAETIHRVLRAFSPGVVVGAAVGYALPLGALGNDAGGRRIALGDVTGNLGEGALQIGYQPTLPLFVGGYVGLAFGGAGDAARRECGAGGLSCSTHAVGLGVGVEYRFGGEGRVSPWGGLGVASETLVVRRRRDGFKSDIVAEGADAVLSAGVDVALGSGLTVGPYLDYRPGWFFATTVESYVAAPENAAVVTVATDAGVTGALHHWVSLGIRGRWHERGY